MGLSAHAQTVEGPLEQYAESVGMTYPEDRDDAVSDMIASLLHYARDTGIGWDLALQRAVLHFRCEVLDPDNGILDLDNLPDISNAEEVQEFASKLAVPVGQAIERLEEIAVGGLTL